jgi:hypothetical protein
MRIPDDTEMARLFDRNRQGGHGHRSLVIDVEANHLLDVHPVDMVRPEYRDQFRLGVVEQVEVLKNRVCGSLIPGFAQAHLGWHRSHKMSRQQPAELPAVLEMLDQGL